MFWDLFDSNFKKITCKPTDVNFLKIYISEMDQELEINRIINEKHINEIVKHIYENKLKHNAHVNFLKWLSKNILKVKTEKNAQAKYIENIDQSIEKCGDELKDL